MESNLRKQEVTKPEDKVRRKYNENIKNIINQKGELYNSFTINDKINIFKDYCKSTKLMFRNRFNQNNQD